MEDVCEKCGATLVVGAWPFCGGDPAKHVVVDGFFHEGFEPYVDTQLLDRKDPRCDSVDQRGVRGVWIDSRSKRREIMKEKGLQYGSQKFEDRGKKLYFT
jgi:hypothetical protein